jgi:hypothetical protein
MKLPVFRRPCRALPGLFVSVAIGAALPTPAWATDLPADLVARFTRQVQPLLLNKCAAGACHGGPRGHAPLLHRDPATSADTLANAAALRGVLGPDGDPTPLVQRLSVRHPAAAKSRTLVMTPLTPHDRAVLEGWLVDARHAAPRRSLHDPAVATASHEEPASPPRPPNRFRALLDTGVPPPMPRQQPSEGSRAFSGIIDRRTAPPAAGLTPESDPPSPPRETADSPPARPDAPSSPGPTARGSR